jgi:hypothetical protein
MTRTGNLILGIVALAGAVAVIIATIIAVA